MGRRGASLEAPLPLVLIVKRGIYRVAATAYGPGRAVYIKPLIVNAGSGQRLAGGCVHAQYLRVALTYITPKGEHYEDLSRGSTRHR